MAYIKFEHIIYLLLFVIGLAAPWSFINETSFLRLEHVSPIDFKVLGVGLVSLLFIPFLFQNTNTYSFGLSKSKVLLITLFLYATISVFWSDNFDLFLRKWNIIFLSILTVFLVEKYFNLEKLDNYFLALISLLFVVSFIGVSQNLLNFPSSYILPAHQQPASTFGNKNLANQIIPLIFPLFFYFIKNRVSLLKSLFLIAAFFISITYLYLSETKSVWLSIFFQIILIFIYFLFTHIRSKTFSVFKKYFLISALTIVLLSLLAFSTNNKIVQSIESKFQSVYSTLVQRVQDPNATRKVLYKSALNLITKEPYFGYGLGNYRDAINQEGIHKKIKRAHNDILELILELGLFGLIIFSAFVVLTIKQVFKISSDQNYSDYMAYLSIAFIGSFINAQFSFPYQNIHAPILLSIYLGIIFKFDTNSQSQNISFKTTKWFNSVLITLTISLLLFFLYKDYQNIRNLGQLYSNSGTQGSKYNYEELKSASSYPASETHLYDFGNQYWRAGYKDRAIEIYGIVTSSNKNANFLRLQEFKYWLEAKNRNKINEIYTFMKEYHPNHPFTFEMGMNIALLDRDLKKANQIYEYFKNLAKYKDANFFKDPNLYRYLHRWSISTQNYQDTEKYYNTTISVLAKKPSIENWMAKYYAYQNDFDKAYFHMSFVLDNMPELADERVLNALLKMGKLSQSEVDNKYVIFYLTESHYRIFERKNYFKKAVKLLESLINNKSKIDKKVISLINTKIMDSTKADEETRAITDTERKQLILLSTKIKSL